MIVLLNFRLNINILYLHSQDDLDCDESSSSEPAEKRMLLNALCSVHEDIETLNVVENIDVACDKDVIALREFSENVITNKSDHLQTDSNSNSTQGFAIHSVEPLVDSSDDSDAYYNEQFSEDENVGDTITKMQVMF